MRKVTALILAGGLLIGAISPANAKPVKVFEDAAGDAGNQDTGVPGFDQAGFDLVGGSIDTKGANLEFTVEHAAALPNFGSGPEVARFLWHFTVDGKQFRFSYKSADIGKPDAIAGTGTERVGQVYAAGTARLETCAETPSPAITLINCSAVEYLDVKIDAAAKTFTIILPMKFVKAKAGSVITGSSHASGGSGCMICWVFHLAERSLTATTIIDSAGQAVSYKVPK